VAIGPLLPAIQADLSISHAVSGLLTTIPVLCMGIFALAGPWLGRRLGTERAIAASVAAIVVFGLLRSAAPEPISLLILTFGLGVGVGAVGPLLPVLVQQRAAHRAATVTGIYAGGIVVGTTLASALAVPLAGAELNWRLPLALFSLAALAGLLVAQRIVPAGQRASEDLDVRPPRLPWLRRRAWVLAVIFGAQSILFYAANSWLPAIYVERGWPQADAGLLVGLMNGVSLVGTFAAPVLADRIGRRASLAFAAGGPLAGFLGVTVAPDLALLWVTCIGIGSGAIFPLALTLPVDFARAGESAGGLAAIMLFGGYALAAAGPFVFGILRDATGTFGAGLWLMTLIAVAMVAMSWWLLPAGLGRRRTG